MKATGVIRRIDDLGRVVIPKAIREQFRIREGDPLEIYTDGTDTVIFKKYIPADPERQLLEAANIITQAINTMYDNKEEDCDYQLLKSFAYYINSKYEETD